MTDETNTAEPLEMDGDVLRRLGTDGLLWAQGLSDALHRQTMLRIDPSGGDTLHVWLCNAIEAGRNAGYAAGQADADASWGQMFRDGRGAL